MYTQIEVTPNPPEWLALHLGAGFCIQGTPPVCNVGASDKSRAGSGISVTLGGPFGVNCIGRSRLGKKGMCPPPSWILFSVKFNP